MMNLAALDLNLLVALEALLEEASVGRAADRVALSQPAMSHALKRLRILLGDPLLVRVGPRMQLTARGEALRDSVKDVLSRVRDLLVIEKFDAALGTRTFHLFVSDYAGDLLLPLARKQLQHQAPGISIRVKNDGRVTVDSFELAQSVDLAIACVPNSFKGFCQYRLFTDRDACAVRRGNPITNQISRQADFLKMKHVAVIGREFAEHPVDTWLHAEGCQRSIALTVPHYFRRCMSWRSPTSSPSSRSASSVRTRQSWISMCCLCRWRSEHSTNTCSTRQPSIPIQDVGGFEEFCIMWRSP